MPAVSQYCSCHGRNELPDERDVRVCTVGGGTVGRIEARAHSWLSFPGRFHPTPVPPCSEDVRRLLTTRARSDSAHRTCDIAPEDAYRNTDRKSECACARGAQSECEHAAAPPASR